jgi:hypothetical protein
MRGKDVRNASGALKTWKMARDNVLIEWKVVEHLSLEIARSDSIILDYVSRCVHGRRRRTDSNITPICSSFRCHSSPPTPARPPHLNKSQFLPDTQANSLRAPEPSQCFRDFIQKRTLLSRHHFLPAPIFIRSHQGISITAHTVISRVQEIVVVNRPSTCALR